ncbi:MAG: metal ABC transporter substrate-binding protein [Lachnospiraceae bacterium]|nr:metal ABC transporter substrate-binding protein [Lachnospiraceae bacterium]
MKKKLSVFVVILLVACSLSGCGTAAKSEAVEAGERLRIVTTIFPEYDWVMNVLGEQAAGAEVTMLLDNGVDLHSYQPTAADIMKISVCDLFVYVGGESDEWVEDALQEATNKDMEVINLLGELGDAVKEEEVVEGMQEEEHDHDHGHEEEDEDHDHDEDHDEDHEEDHDHDHDHDHEEETEYDEHVWLSLRNAAVLVSSISDALQQIDGLHAADYQANAKAYIEKLNALDAQYQAAVDSAANRTILFGDRFPFRYLVDDYGISYYAAFVGCSAETEASFETVAFLAQKTDELSLPAVMTIEGADHRIAETIVQNTETKDQQILTMDSMQSTTSGDVQNGTTYLSVMEQNLSVLKEALR